MSSPLDCFDCQYSKEYISYPLNKVLMFCSNTKITLNMIEDTSIAGSCSEFNDDIWLK